MLVCEQCGYGLYRTSTHTTKHKLNYYRCIGSDGYRRLRGPVCTNRPIRQDYLDEFVWTEIIRLLEGPELIEAEIDRRRAAARNADPLRKRQEELHREQVRIEKNSERLVTAYQEGLVTLSQLRQRMPALQKQAQAIGSELQSLEMAAVDQARYLQLAESLGDFRTKLRARANTLDIAARQQILRLVVKEVLVGADTITLRHSLPIPQSGPRSNGSSAPPTGGVTEITQSPGYLLRSGSHQPPAGQSVSALRVRCLDGPKLASSAVRAVRGRYHRPLQDGAGSEPGACQNSGTVEAVWIGTASGEDESGLLQGCQSARGSLKREVRLPGVHVSASESDWSERDLL
jgi:site-specific DNA recombinase